MKYKVHSEEWGYYSLDLHTELDPNDFLDCEDEDAFFEAVEDYIDMNSDSEIGRDVSLDERTDIEYNIPDELVKEWKKLKGIKDED